MWIDIFLVIFLSSWTCSFLVRFYVCLGRFFHWGDLFEDEREWPRMISSERVLFVFRSICSCCKDFRKYWYDLAGHFFLSVLYPYLHKINSKHLLLLLLLLWVLSSASPWQLPTWFLSFPFLFWLLCDIYSRLIFSNVAFGLWWHLLRQWLRWMVNFLLHKIWRLKCRGLIIGWLRCVKFCCCRGRCSTGRRRWEVGAISFGVLVLKL